MHKRIVIKIGSQLVVGKTGIDSGYLKTLVQELKQLDARKYSPVVVLSGAVAAGKVTTKLTTKHSQAAVGQTLITQQISQHAADANLPIAQILLTRDDITHRERYEALRHTLTELLDRKITPIINENDATTLAADNAFVDNDQLATIIAMLLEADKLLLLTSVDGVFSGNPAQDPNAKLIKKLAHINVEMIKQTRSGKSQLGRGGMEAKLRAVRLASVVGIPTCIMNGSDPKNITQFVLNGGSFGTLCVPLKKTHGTLKGRDVWILSAHNSGASIQMDSGASAAVLQRKSLLAVGVKRIYGRFGKGECVELIDLKKETIALGLSGLESTALEALIRQDKKPFNVEVVHANNLQVIQ